MGRARRPEGAWARGPRGVVSRVLTAVALLAPSALADTPTSESGTSVGTRAESGASFAESPELPVVAAKTEAKPPPPSPPGRNGPACEPSFAARIYRETRNKVVVVERPEGGLGAGFVFHTKRHVLTALHVVEASRYARIVLSSGKAMAGEVVAVDEANDLALLELSGEQPEEPLLPRQHVEPGWPVVALGHPYGTLSERGFEGVLKYSVSQGIVSAVSGAHLQTDALIAPGNSGGPILTCDGRVVGVASQTLGDRIGFAVPILHGVTLAGRERRGVGALPRPDDPSFGLVTHQERAAAFYGVYGGSSVVAGHFALVSHLGIAFAGDIRSPSELTSFMRVRGFFELSAGYRATFFTYSKYTMALTIAAGPTFYIDRGSEKEPVIELEPPGCAGATCTPRLAARTSTYKGGGVLLGPQVRLRFPLSSVPLEVSYAYQIDVRDVPMSTHRVMVGLPF
jgi:S1-C subfamily serine protease